MTNKKIAALALVLVLAPIWVPVVLVAQVVSVALWYLGLAQSTNVTTKYPNGGKAVEVSGRASRLIGCALKIGGMGLFDLSVSPALALPTKGLIVFRSEMCARYTYLTQQFIGAHEMGHLIDPLAKKMFSGMKIDGEFRADAHAVKALALTVGQVNEIFADLFNVTKEGMSFKERQQLFNILMTRRNRAAEVAEAIATANELLEMF